MKTIYKTKSGKTAIINTSKDRTLIDTLYVGGKDQTQGEDLMVHITQGGIPIFYLYCWSRYQGTIDRVEVLGEIGDPEVFSYIEANYRWLEEEDVKYLSSLGVNIIETA